MDNSGTGINLPLKIFYPKILIFPHFFNLKNYYISALFYNQNPKFNLITFLYLPMFYHFDQIFYSYIFPFLPFFLPKIAPLYESDLKILIRFLYFPHFFITPSHQKITTIGIQSIFKKSLI